MLRGPDARLRLVTALLIAALLPILAQLVRLQVLEREAYLPKIEQLQQRPYTLPMPPSGVILDRNGDLLVGNMPIYDVGAEVNLVGNVTSTLRAANRLSATLGLSPEALFDLLYYEPIPGDENRTVWRSLAKGLGPEVGEDIKELQRAGWWWLTLQPKWTRYYAEGDLACHALGFVNMDGHGYGVESLQQRFLRPSVTNVKGLVTIGHVPLAEELALGKLRAYPGTDLVLTLDRTIQAFVEGELRRALLEYGAASGTILVMDPRTGALIASASLPCYEPYAYSRYSDGGGGIFTDPAISETYEPGSVLKVITVAAALDSGAIGRDWSYYDNGRFEYGGILVTNSDRQAHGWQNLQGLLDSSLNVGAATLATQHLGASEFYRYIRAFGFGQTMGIGVANEERGIVHLPEDYRWRDSYLVTNSFGQGIAMTPLQLATAVSALANHGVMMAPYLVAERQHPDGRVVTTVPHRWSSEPPISAETADFVAQMMVNTVNHRYTTASVPGYQVAGKTGTAQIPIAGGYSPSEVITSFIAFAPWPEPEVLVLVKLDRPQNERHLRWGTQTAAPVFSRMAERLFTLLGIPSSDSVGEPQG
jgi:cell division protein FtsI/penicillin-binding protein 2